ncbi:heat shock 70 kDa protein-like isoform X2 [Pecten maximus]|uniref:heat shock 70 kDa protein-like isoform X2 n=1 Tax=Pecten maximus TaxID=6579 RepID=UPI001458FAC6|nr:heat shock 70 kDa protein-like isoform X2 [Pecten maximus]
MDTVDTVVAVPVDLSDAGRQAVKDACSDVGLNILRVINEATSACIAHELDNKFPDKEIHALVIDMGGSTFNLTILLIEDGIYEVVHTAAHSDVSGNKFDERLADFLINAHDKKNKTNLRDDARIMQRMRTACCKAKECLSSSSYTNILIENLQNDKDYKTSVTKPKFEELNMDLFHNAVKLVDGSLKNSHLSEEDIYVVVMVGGSTKIPKLVEMMTDRFQGRVLASSIDPEDVVSFGCVMQAMVLAGNVCPGQLTDLLLLDVEPLSLGLETAENVMTVMIPRNATVPCKKCMTFTTYHDNQVTMLFRLFEGERCFATDNNDLGMFEMTGIWAEPQGRARIDVTFDIDANGVLTITTVNRFSRKTQSFSLTNFKSYYDMDELEDIIETANDTRESDEKKMLVLTSKLLLLSFITNLESAMEERETDINIDVKETVTKKCREVRDWMANQESVEQSMYEEKLSLLENEICSHRNLNRDIVTQCRNHPLHFISGRTVNNGATKSQGLAKGWGKGRVKGRTRGNASSTPVVSVPSTRPVPAVEFPIEEVD